MESLPPSLYEQCGKELGHDPRLVVRASKERSRLVDRGVEPILTLGHLAHLTGISYRYLREVVERRRDPYVDVQMRKARGGARPISSPEPPLMAVHRWLLRNVLEGIPLHPASFAYRKGHSIVSCAERHRGARWIVKLDLHDFFGSIGESRVYRLFQGLGYANLVSFELARICTRLVKADTVPRIRSRRYTGIPTYSVSPPGHVPQGAPSSGAIANAVATPLDGKLAGIANGAAWTYTRYSDDLIFSSGGSYTRADAVQLVREASDAIRSEGLQVHRNKTRIVPPGARRVVLGLLVDDGQLRLLPEFKRRVEVHVWGVGRFGLTHHADHRNFRSIFSLINHVDGCLAFAQCVEPQWVAGIRLSWQEALLRSGMPTPDAR